jgi:hypothetical protein
VVCDQIVHIIVIPDTPVIATPVVMEMRAEGRVVRTNHEAGEEK